VHPRATPSAPRKPLTSVNKLPRPVPLAASGFPFSSPPSSSSPSLSPFPAPAERRRAQCRPGRLGEHCRPAPKSSGAGPGERCTRAILHSKYPRALAFENLCQAERLPHEATLERQRQGEQQRERCARPKRERPGHKGTPAASTRPHGLKTHAEDRAAARV
jgi:hypothetical protein